VDYKTIKSRHERELNKSWRDSVDHSQWNIRRSTEGDSQGKRELHSRKLEQGIVHYSKLTGRELGWKMAEHVKRAQEKKKTENISWGDVRRGARSDGKPSGSRSCLTGNLSRLNLRISSPSCGGLAGFRPTTVHSRRGNSTTTTTTPNKPSTKNVTFRLGLYWI